MRERQYFFSPESPPNLHQKNKQRWINSAGRHDSQRRGSKLYLSPWTLQKKKSSRSEEVQPWFSSERCVDRCMRSAGSCEAHCRWTMTQVLRGDINHRWTDTSETKDGGRQTAGNALSHHWELTSEEEPSPSRLGPTWETGHDATSSQFILRVNAAPSISFDFTHSDIKNWTLEWRWRLVKVGFALGRGGLSPSFPQQSLADVTSSSTLRVCLLFNENNWSLRAEVLKHQNTLTC